MYDNQNDTLNYGKWNRRLMNLYWACNAIILIVEAVVAALYYKTTFIPPLPVYLYKFVFMPSFLILLLTACCEFAVWLLRDNYKNLQPYIITFTAVAFCAVLLIIHYSVTVIFVVYAMPVFFSLVYNNKRVLLYTFLFSLLVFAGVYIGYFKRAELPYLYMSVADIPAIIAILVISYLIGRIILNRFEEIMNIMAEAQRSAYESKMARESAEASAEARTRFLANMSHEIRTPMNGIIGLAELALGGGTLCEDQEDYLLKIRTSADGLLAIINDILDISKIDAGEFSLQEIPFDLYTVLNECETIIKHKAGEKGLRIYFYDETKLDAKIVGDPTKLRQALLNFLSNAVKFTKTGSVTLTARCDETARSSGKVVICFEISDTGIGITEEQLEMIFEPFSQADDSATRSFGGTGLGLPIAKSIVESMGAEIKVKSIPGVGSIFSFSPEFEISNEKCTPVSDSCSGLSHPIFNGDILLCEDDAINQQVAMKNFEKLGFSVFLAENGKAGVDTVARREQENRPFDIIFMDIHMPVMDGLRATEKLVEMGVKTPVIAMTANAMAQDRQKCMDAGMADYIYKPFKAQELWSCLMRHLTPVDTSTDAGDKRAVYADYGGHEVNAAINKTVGMEHFAGNEELYRRMLGTFLDKYAQTPMFIEKAVSDGDFPLAHKIAHTVKGAAAIIGADRLSGLSSVLEEAFKSGGSHYNRGMMDDYKKEFDVVVECISAMTSKSF